MVIVKCYSLAISNLNILQALVFQLIQINCIDIVYLNSSQEKYIKNIQQLIEKQETSNDKQWSYESCILSLRVFKLSKSDDYGFKYKIYRHLLQNGYKYYYVLQSIIILPFYNLFMNILKRSKQVFLELDMFYSTNIIKYESEAQYKTMLGAVTSLIIIVAIIAGFSKELISTVQKTTIESTLQIRKSEDPPEMVLTPLDHNYMFGVSITNFHGNIIYDLASGPQIFEVKGLNVQSKDGTGLKHVNLDLVSCTRQHWKMIPNLIDKFDKLNVKNWVCPSLKALSWLKGFQSSGNYRTISVSVKSCVNSSTNGNRCANQSDIDATLQTFSSYQLKFKFVNSVINPNEPNYLKYYLEDRNFALFSKSSGTQMNLQFSEYEITSDNSFLPYQDLSRDYGYVVQDRAFVNSFTIAPNDLTLARIRIAKSPNELVYTRKVLKISEVLSYIGGLIGAIAMLLFLIKIYTEVSLDMHISFNLFHEQKKEENEQQQQQQQQQPIEKDKEKSFYFTNFVSLYLYKLQRFFNKGQDNVEYKKMQQYQQEIMKHLDIKIMLKRIIKLELCMSHLFDQDQIQGIQCSEQITLEKAKYLRTFLHKHNEQDDIIMTRKILTQKNKTSEMANSELGESQYSGIVIVYPPAQANERDHDKRQTQIKNLTLMAKSLKQLKDLSDTNVIKKKIFEDIRPEIKKTYEQFHFEQIPDVKLVQRKELKQIE